TASIPAIAVSSPTTASVTVANPAPGGGISNAVDFVIATPLTFNYLVSGQSAVSVLPGGTVALPATDVGGSSAVQFQIVNAGSIPATVSSVSASGAVFSLSAVPTLPVTLPANGSLSFTVGFAPTAPGNSTGTLTINNSSFALTGSATISPLTYRYTLPGGSPTNISPGGTIPFQSVAAGGSSSAQFQIVNPSSGSASVSTVTSNSSLFTLGTLPTFPATIPAGGSLDLSLTFRPATPGSSTASLTVGTRTFLLSGTGLTSDVSLTGLTDVVPPAQQPRVGVDLTAATAVPLTGQLVLTFTPTADVPSDDPAVQFATGGRSVNFTIPANGTKSDFGGSPDIAFSTGTVAGTLRLVVTLRNGSADVTPTSPDPNRTVILERRAPTITSVAVASRTASGFEIVVVGYSTPRSLSQAAFRFSPRAGSNVQSGDVTLSVTSQFTTWYQSADSQQFGSQFRMRIPFTVQGDINALGSVSVTLTNAAGTSEPTSTSF
ncbi:MAG TPA: choice-of-anchor D domain-containing protein, partial [Terriglobia bacterium]|nr:choice-of-anchor D domain-containing protein [Terriglobia bacterium]